MRTSFSLGGTEVHLPNAALTLLLGIAGGFVARALGLPLAFMLGAIVATGAASIGGVQLAGRLPALPQALRAVFVPIIGVSIGGLFRPEIFREAAQWWPSLVALVAFIPLAHYAGYRTLRATGRLDPVTTFFGTAPGGLIETVQMSEEMGADVTMVATLQFLRLILTVMLVPIGFAWLTGHAVGSAAGASAGPAAPIGFADVAILTAAGGFGMLAGRRIGLPAGIVTGPIVLSAAAHLSGLTQAAPPGWLIAATQVVIGTTLGVRFAGVPPSRFVLGLRLALTNVTITIALALGLAFLLGPLVEEPPAAVFLAFAPGGLAEMSLVALSLHLSVIYVTAHHVARIVLAVTVARIFSRRIGRG